MSRDTPPSVPADPRAGGRKTAALTVLALLLTGAGVLWSAATPAVDPVGRAAQALPGLLPGPVSEWLADLRSPATLRADLMAARRAVPGGDPTLAPAIMADHGCGACHVIPGIAGARGTVGPTLQGFARRAYIAGQVQNAPLPLVAWLRDPPALDPATAMPDTGLTEPEARHVAAWLLAQGTL